MFYGNLRFSFLKKLLFPFLEFVYIRFICNMIMFTSTLQQTRPMVMEIFVTNAPFVSL